MRLGAVVGQATEALLRHKLRSLLSTLGIVFAVTAVVAMLALLCSLSPAAAAAAWPQRRRGGSSCFLVVGCLSCLYPDVSPVSLEGERDVVRLRPSWSSMAGRGSAM